MKKYLSNSKTDTRRLAEKLAKQISPGIIALSGELGSGKTTFAAGFAKGLGIKEKIISPTFVLIRQHKMLGNRILFHIDLYRLGDEINIKELGLWEIISNPNNLVLIEWAEKIEKFLPKNTTKIKIEKGLQNERIITVS